MSKNSDASTSGFTVLSFLWRWIAALLLVLATFNPTGRSVYHWTAEAVSNSTFGPLNLLVIALLLAGWAVFWIATWRALNTLGVALAGLILGAIIWLLIDVGWIRTDSVSRGRTSPAGYPARSASRISTTDTPGRPCATPASAGEPVPAWSAVVTSDVWRRAGEPGENDRGQRDW
jgi:hypothetical protein